MRNILLWLTALGLVASACTDSPDDRSSVTTVAAISTIASTETLREEVGPTHGGRLVYGIEADSTNPWIPYETSCAISCRMVLRSVTDALFITDERGELQPYLVATSTPNDDRTEWTLTVRDGISFHDGTPLDGAAVKYNIDACRLGALTAPMLLGIDEVVADGQNVTLIFDQPSATGAKAALRTDVCGLMFSPTWMQTLPGNPLHEVLTDAKRDELQLGGSQTAPVGLGAFRFVSYVAGDGNSFIAVRNPDYWRGDGPSSLTGEGLPFLDEIEFVVTTDDQLRSDAVASGLFHIIHTATNVGLDQLDENDDVDVRTSSEFADTSYVLLNVASGSNPTLATARGLETISMDPSGRNTDNPLVHLSCRRALANSLSVENPANGPFPPGAPGSLVDTGYPNFDLDAAAENFSDCKADHGIVPVTFTLATTDDAFNIDNSESIAAMWRSAFGEELDVTVTPVPSEHYAAVALTGTFQAQSWRNHGGVEPEEQWYWWNATMALPIAPDVPELARNFGRFQDPLMDQQFVIIRQDPDPAARRAAAEAVSRLFGENVWNLWTSWTNWTIASRSSVQNVVDLPIPDTGFSTMPVIGGAHHLSQIWCLGGVCN